MLSGRFFPGRAAAIRCGGGCAMLLAAVSAPAWGPHETITQAALNALGTNDALVLLLGPQAPRLTNYAWMGDYFGVVVEDRDTLFYADDYLLFPALPRYVDHTGPEVRDAFQPFFRRALQALRTEDRANAARWVGALLHFVQDAGCPPHAAGLRGDVHSKMEDWVEADRIRIPDHTPASLGADDASAMQALQRRLHALFPEAQERGRRLRVPVEIGNRSAVQDPMLQSALTCARLTADLLYTLGQLSSKGLTGSATLRGTVSSRPPVGMERFPAKIVLQGTAFSTLADLSGRYEFRHLPPVRHTVVAFRSGNGATQAVTQLKAGETVTCDLNLPPTPDNLVLNGDFTLSWIRPNAPDYWYQTKTGWEGAPILLRDGQRYRLTVQLKEDARNLVLARWLRRPERALPRFKIEPRFDTRTLTATNRDVIFTGSPEKGLLHLTLRGRGRPQAVCDGISLVPLPPEESRTP